MAWTNPYGQYQNYSPYQATVAPTYNPNNYQQPQAYGTGSLMTVFVDKDSDVTDYPVAAGTTVLLISFKLGKFWLKSTATNGVPQPLREFNFSELSQQSQNQNDPVSRAEFNALNEKIDKLLKDLGGDS